MRVEGISTYKCLEKLWPRVSTKYALVAALTTLLLLGIITAIGSLFLECRVHAGCQFSLPFVSAPHSPKAAKSEPQMSISEGQRPFSHANLLGAESSQSPGPAVGAVRAAVSTQQTSRLC